MQVVHNNLESTWSSYQINMDQHPDWPRPITKLTWTGYQIDLDRSPDHLGQAWGSYQINLD